MATVESKSQTQDILGDLEILAGSNFFFSKRGHVREKGDIWSAYCTSTGLFWKWQKLLIKVTNDLFLPSDCGYISLLVLLDEWCNYVHTIIHYLIMLSQGCLLIKTS